MRNKAVFLDRDGTISIEKNYLYKPEDFKFIDGSIGAIRLLNRNNYKVIVVTNQAGVARGYYTEREVDRLHHYINEELKKHNAVIDAFYYCPHHPNGKGKYKIECNCRKPKTGLFEKAVSDFRVDVTKSYLIGDKASDIEAGKRVGMETILVETGYGKREKNRANYDELVPDFPRAVDYILELNKKEKIELLGIEINNFTMSDALGRVEALIESRKKSMVFPLNVYMVVKIHKDKVFKSVLSGGDIILSDGMSLLWGAKILGRPLREKVSGSDLLPAFCEIAAKKGYKLFFLGAGPGVAAKAARILTQKNPGLQIVGVYSPPFGFEDDEEENKKIVQMIREAKPHVLFVGLGAPKQEEWIWKHKDEIGVPVSIAVGATFDFVAGTVKRAPKWMQKSSLEWFFRVCQEPRRLWKRYFIANTIFIWLVLKEFLKVRMLGRSSGLEGLEE